MDKKNLDTETHVEDLENKAKILKKKERFRGIHKPPTVTRKVTGSDNNNMTDVEQDSENNDMTDVDQESSPVHDSVDQVLNAQSNLDSEEPPSMATFKPRRQIRDSPFKNCVLQKPIQDHIPMTINIHENDTDQTDTRYLDTPEQVKHELKDFKVQWNSGGGSCLFKAALQHINANTRDSVSSYLELRKHAHSKLVEWWSNFENFFVWPLSVTVGTGNTSRQKTILSAEEFKQFLASDDSMETFNETEVEVWLLAYIMNTTICVLSYNLPEGQGVGCTRFMWRYYCGNGVVTDSDNARYSSGANCLYLLHEHLVHWSRMVEAKSLSPKSLDDDFISGNSEGVSTEPSLNDSEAFNSESVSQNTSLSASSETVLKSAEQVETTKKSSKV